MINNVLGWVIFAIAAFTFVSCIEPTASFWDCGEYIACCDKLEVGHPPGAPTFLLIGRFFALFAKDPAHLAACVNTMTALASAGTILFMFWSISLLGKKLVTAMNQEFTDARMWAVLGSAAVGSLAYAFTDSFWFSAVEGEVYGMSSFFTALVFWAILRWDADDSARSDRWIVLIAYMIGLSIGVHLLNLLTIPSIVFIIYFKKYHEWFRQNPAKPFWTSGVFGIFGRNRGLIFASLSAVGLLGVVQNGIIPGVVSAAANYELFFVNSIGLPFNAGTIIYFALLIGLIVTGMRYTLKGGKKLLKQFLYVGGAFFFFTLLAAFMYGSILLPFLTFVGAATIIYYLKENRVVLNTILLSFTVLLIGYSSFFVLVIRSKANTPMDENNPENAISLLSYLNREQYGDWPLAYGPYYDATLNPEDQFNDNTPIYAQDVKMGNYAVSDSRKQSVYNWAPEMCTVFPRMYDMSQHQHITGYEQWGDVKHNSQKVTIKFGENERKYTIPNFTANLTYFWDYQIQFMYWRYFMWNFVGRQNDMQGEGDLTKGNWQSGFDMGAISKKDYPSRFRTNKANNSFYYIPMLLGLFGMWFHFRRDWKSAIVIMLLFLFTGLAIVVYLNQAPFQPRERDYAYAGSFYAFAFYIGFAVYGIYDLLTRYAKSIPQMAAVGLSTAACMSAPYLLGSQGWDDHNRSNRYTCRDFAENYLTSCDKNAVLFTNGDNDTFPLWYAQEVENYRTDVRVLNLSLMNTDWYIDQAKRKAYDSDAVPFSLTHPRYREGSFDEIKFPDNMWDEKKNVAVEGPLMNLDSVMAKVRVADKSVLSLDPRDDDSGDRFMDTTLVLPTNHFYISVSKEEKAWLKKTGSISADVPDSLIQDRVEFFVQKHYMYKADLMILDLLATNHWKRPIYFAVTGGSDSFMNLENNFQLEGLTYHLLPLPRKQRGVFGETVGCDVMKMYAKIMGNGKDQPGFHFGGLDVPGKNIYMDENNLRFPSNTRYQMMELAKLLNDDGQHDMAKKVLDRCLSGMPKEYVPYENPMVYMVDIYYKTGAQGMKDGNNLSKDLFDQSEEEFVFYSKLETKDKSGGGDYEEEAGRRAQGMSMCWKFAKDFGQTDIEKNYKSRLDKLGIDPIKYLPQDMRQDLQQEYYKKQRDSMMKAMKLDSDVIDSEVIPKPVAPSHR